MLHHEGFHHVYPLSNWEQLVQNRLIEQQKVLSKILLLLYNKGFSPQFYFEIINHCYLLLGETN